MTLYRTFSSSPHIHTIKQKDNDVMQRVDIRRVEYVWRWNWGELIEYSTSSRMDVILSVNVNSKQFALLCTYRLSTLFWSFFFCLLFFFSVGMAKAFGCMSNFIGLMVVVIIWMLACFVISSGDSLLWSVQIYMKAFGQIPIPITSLKSIIRPENQNR